MKIKAAFPVRFIHTVSSRKVADGVEITVNGTVTVIKDGGQGKPGNDGKDGKDGKTPVVRFERVSDGVQMKVDGTLQATVNDGIKGDDGHTPVVSIIPGAGQTTITIDDKSAVIKDGEKGDTGKTGAVFKPKWSGTTLSFEKVSATDATTAISGINLKGDKGDKGDNGTNGTNGTNGKDGAVFKPVWDGTKLSFSKVDASSVTSTTIAAKELKGDKGDKPVITTRRDNTNGITTILADGTSIGTVKDGIKGNDGADGKIWKPVINDSGYISWELTTSTASLGSTLIKGPQGAQGPQGKQGDKGDKGEQGIQGPKGDTGATGATGPQGKQGATGATGTRGSVINQGTAITGTSTTATVFSSSGLSSSLVNDMYINTSTSNIYKCTTAGNASTAKWVYAGCIKGKQGDKGATGATGANGTNGITWRPTVSNGTLSWTKDSSTSTPASSVVKGDKGADGKTWKPTVSSDGVVSWALDSNTDAPAPVRVKPTATDIQNAVKSLNSLTIAGITFAKTSGGTPFIRIPSKDNADEGVLIQPDRITVIGHKGTGVMTQQAYASLIPGSVCSSANGTCPTGTPTLQPSDQQLQTSDIRLKDVKGGVELTVDGIADAPIFDYTLKDGDELYSGTSAQYWQNILPNAVKTSADGYLGMMYGNAAMVAVVSLAREVKRLKEEIRGMSIFDGKP